MTETSHKPKWLTPTIAAGAAILLIAGGATGWHAYTTNQYETAKTACFQAADTVRETANQYNTILNGEAAKAAAITKTQVQDAKTVSGLAKELKAQAPTYEGCTMDDTKGLQTAADTLNGQADWYRAHAKTLKTLSGKVTASKLAKDIEDAKTLLKTGIDDATKTWKDTEGKVADDDTRAQLKTVIDEATKTMGTKNPKSAQPYTDAKTKLDQAMKAVNDSKNAKDEADRQAAEAAAQAQASTGSTGSSGTYRKNNSSNGGTYRKSGGSSSSGTSGSNGGAYTTDNPAGKHQFWKDATSGKSCSFDTYLGDGDFNDNPMTCK
ncbi:colicin transporter [Bifidobacterium saguinibicoloris]|uniref:colicin transporter n=1 Tax=Bifidobacterium saguinibicoloris TaxID=2834433 RepID=UPI001C59C3B2|nr:colicin transporter [Bifidobacterium saguinibicoloris]MBW3081556.1 colicin transporter [Bifidobacterium saguinibicoloris]